MKKHKLQILFLIFFLVGIGLIGLIIYFNNGTSPTPNNIDNTVFPTSVPLRYKSPTVLSVSPEIDQVLVPGQTQTFNVTFNESVQDKQIKILLTRDSIAGGSESSVSIQSNLESFGKELIIKTTETIQPAQKYSLIILGPNDTTLLSTTYMSANIDPSYIDENNVELKQYLPYETNNYKLSYLERRNIYIFNFKYNSSSATTIGDQFNQAKQEAESFIESKGININSIVIEWRHS